MVPKTEARQEKEAFGGTTSEMQGRAPSVRLDEADRDVDTSPLVISDDEDPHSCHPRPTQAAHDRRMSCSSCRVSERKQTTALLLTVTCFLFMDQSLLAPHLTDVAVFFNYTDTQRDTKLGGELSFSLFLVGAPAAIVVGHLADRLNRRNLYTSVVLLGELGCFLVVFVRHYWQLFLLRALTGIALGGAVPLVFSILSDLYSSDERPPVAALVGVAAGAGAGIGQGVSAVVGQAYGWRAPFALVAVPSCVFALIFRFFAAEPRRGSQERREHSPNEIVSESAEFSSALRLGRQENAQMGADFGRAGKHEVRGGGAASLRQILERRSNLIIFLQGMPGCVPWSVILVYLNDYLVEDRGAPTKLAAVVVCTGWGVGATVGQLVGGWAGQRLLRSAAHQRGRICYMMGCSTVLAVVPLLLVLNCEFAFGAVPAEE